MNSNVFDHSGRDHRRGSGRAPTITNALPDGAASRNRGLPDVSLVIASRSVSSLAASSAGGEFGAASVSVVAAMRRLLPDCLSAQVRRSARRTQRAMSLQSIGEHRDALPCPRRAHQPSRRVTAASEFGGGTQRLEAGEIIAGHVRAVGDRPAELPPFAS
jgi:hypothetical protein